MSTISELCHARIILIGETKVGKTSLLRHYLREHPGSQSATVGAAFYTHHTTFNGVNITLQIWDTAGQERYRSIGPIYYRKAQVAIAVFDLTAPETMQALSTWISVFREHADDSFVLIVGNKSDQETKLTLEETIEFAQQFDSECVWTCAINGDHVTEVFEKICEHIINGRFSSKPQEVKDLTTDANTDGKGGGCTRC
jgi:small GTP-binding protein